MPTSPAPAPGPQVRVLLLLLTVACAAVNAATAAIDMGYGGPAAEAGIRAAAYALFAACCVTVAVLVVGFARSMWASAQREERVIVARKERARLTGSHTTRRRQLVNDGSGGSPVDASAVVYVNPLVPEAPAPPRLPGLTRRLVPGVHVDEDADAFDAELGGGSGFPHRLQSLHQREQSSHDPASSLDAGALRTFFTRGASSVAAGRAAMPAIRGTPRQRSEQRARVAQALTTLDDPDASAAAVALACRTLAVAAESSSSSALESTASRMGALTLGCLAAVLRGPQEAVPLVAEAACTAIVAHSGSLADPEAASAVAAALLPVVEAHVDGGQALTGAAGIAALSAMAAQAPEALLRAGGFDVLMRLMDGALSTYHEHGRTEAADCTLSNVATLCRALSAVVEVGGRDGYPSPLPCAALATPLIAALSSPALCADAEAAEQVCWLLGNAAAAAFGGAELAAAFTAAPNAVSGLVRLLDEARQSAPAAQGAVALQACVAVCALAAHPVGAVGLVAAGALTSTIRLLHNATANPALAEAGCSAVIALLPAADAHHDALDGAAAPACGAVIAAIAAVIASPAAQVDAQAAMQAACALRAALALEAVEDSCGPEGETALFPLPLAPLCALLRSHAGHRSTLEAVAEALAVALGRGPIDALQTERPGVSAPTLTETLRDTIAQHPGAAFKLLRSRLRSCQRALLSEA